jgi:hypothetical protein
VLKSAAVQTLSFQQLGDLFHDTCEESICVFGGCDCALSPLVHFGGL